MADLALFRPARHRHARPRAIPPRIRRIRRHWHRRMAAPRYRPERRLCQAWPVLEEAIITTLILVLAIVAVTYTH